MKLWFKLITIALVFGFTFSVKAEDLSKPFQVAGLIKHTKDSNGNYNYIDINDQVDVSDMTYSATWDAGVDLNNVNFLTIPVCFYNRLPQLSGGKAELLVNKFFIADKSKALLGIDKADSCPLPGNMLLSDYPTSIAGEFIISGAMCLVNSIISDAMFRVYCTIILWFYNILFSMIIIYVMFYGLSIMLGIGNDPIKEAPKRILKIIIIFGLAVNAQIGFRYVHNGFITVLNAFTDMLVDLQPYHTESGSPAYKKSFLSSVFSSVGVDIITEQGALLDEDGHKWKPVPAGTHYYDMYMYNYKKSIGAAVTLADVKKSVQGIPSNYSASETTTEKEYVPFRVPAMLWTYAEDPKGSGNYKMYPVFQDASQGAYNNHPTNVTYYYCIFDLKWNSSPVDEKGRAWVDPTTNQRAPGRLEKNAHCQKNLWPTQPNIAPYKEYAVFKIDNATTDPKEKGKLVPIDCSAPPAGVNCNAAQANTVPPKLQKITYDTWGSGSGSVQAISQSTLYQVCQNPIFWWTCRQPFQGVLSRLDAMFNSIFGDDNSKNISSLLIALSLWGLGAGAFLAIFLMTGLLTLFIATMQLIWTYVTAIMALTFLLMLSPIFIGCALFKITEKFFKGWLASVISFTLQPFLVLAFVYFISGMVSLDRLTKLAREEVRNKIYVSKPEGNDSAATFAAPSFVEPLYEKPSDFDEFYVRNYNTNTNINAQGVADNSNIDKIYITGAQRDIYLKNKSDKILMRWVADYVGTTVGSINSQSEANKVASDAQLPFLDELFTLWNTGVYMDYAAQTELPNGGGPSGIANPNYEAAAKTDKRGMMALNEYKWHHRNYTGDARVLNIDAIMTCWKAGCTLGGTFYKGIDPSGAAADMDDDDAFVGEPAANDTWGYKSPEFPVCQKYCPAFKPEWDASNPATVNPRLNPVKDTLPDGTPCPDVYDNTQSWNTSLPPDGVPDICAPTAECTKHCMKITGEDSKDSAFSTLFSAILIWIVINSVMGAFMSQVPKLAQSLSNWENYAPSITMGGASKGSAGNDAWTQAESSSMYHMGGLFETGIITQSAGAVPSFLDQVARVAGGKKERVDPKTGAIVSSGYSPHYYQKDAAAVRKQQQEEQKKADVLARLKSDYGIAKEARMDTENSGSLVSFSRFSGLKSEDIENFAKMRPVWKTGLTHRELWDIIKKVVGTGNPDYSSAKIQIDAAVRDMISRSKPN